MNDRLQNIVYAPLGWALHGLALLPWRVVYWHADALYFLAYRVVGYRKKVVRQNLAECFPEKSESERRDIEKRFYHHFADLFIETVKQLHMTDDDYREHIEFEGMQFVEDSFARGQSVLVYTSHYCNWEWLASVWLWLSDETRARGDVFGAAYHPLRNKWFDRFFIKLRNRYMQCFPSHQVLRVMIRNKQQGNAIGLGFNSDQAPKTNDQGHVIQWLNHPTAMLTGAEAISRKLDLAVGFFDLYKTSRGHYVCNVVPIAEHAAETPVGALTDAYARLLEARIKDEPAYWLWTHKRWKRKVELPSSTPADKS